MKKQVYFRGPVIAWIMLFGFIFFHPQISSAQQIREISGTVRDLADKSGMPGVNVQAKTSGTNAVTGSDGKYTIKVVPGEVLMFSYVG